MNTSIVNIIGIMSGTSLDGLDLAFCRFRQELSRWRYEIVKSITIPYPLQLVECLKHAVDLSALEYVKLDYILGDFIGQEVQKFMNQTKLKPDYIASHGHTVFHQPTLGFTAQIGNGAVIAAKTGIPTVCDFRTIDVAHNGQGAPLVPIGDKLLFYDYDVCLNLGGFSNISYEQSGQRVAFDISPCNLPLNHLAQSIGLSFDKNGEIAQKGNIDDELFRQLNQLPYYTQPAPKSLGIEWLFNDFSVLIENTNLSIEDKLRTVTEHIAFQIGKVIAETQQENVLVTGGGAKNSFLIQRMEEYAGKIITLPSEQVIDYKEALIFAFLGLLRVHGEANCLSSVTGAQQDTCGGAIYWAL